MITLFQPPPGFGAANPSPFCIKLEVLLKMADVDYKTQLEGNPRNGPNGKIPYIKDKGTALGDSDRIQLYLESEYNVEFFEGLNANQKAQSLAFIRLADEHLYWVVIYSRWMEDKNWRIIKKRFFGKMPLILRMFVPNMLRKGVRKSMTGHGIGRHDRATIYAMGAEDLTAIADFIADRDFAFGSTPTAVDAALYGQLSAIIDAPFDTPLKRAALSHDTLSAYCKRMRARYFPNLGDVA